MRPVAFGAVAVAAAAGVLFLVHDPRPVARDGPDWEDSEDVSWADAHEARRAEALIAAGEDAVARVTEKGAAADALVRGELTLDEAAGRFRKLNAGRPDAYRGLADAYPAASEEELAYRQVLLFVRGARFHSTLARAALARLEGEVDRRFPPPTGDPELPPAAARPVP